MSEPLRHGYSPAVVWDSHAHQQEEDETLQALRQRLESLQLEESRRCTRKSQLSRRFLRVPSWLRKGLRVFLQEEDLVYQIDTLDKAPDGFAAV